MSSTSTAVASMHRNHLGGRELPSEVAHVLGDLRGRLDGELLALAYTPANEVLTMEEGGTLRRWDPDTGAQLDSFVLSDLESCWAFSPDGRWLAAGSSSISIWDLSDEPSLVGMMECPWVQAIAFCADGLKLATGHGDNSVCLWHVESCRRQCRLDGHSGEVSALAFSPNGGLLASAGEDRLVIVWDANAGEYLSTLRGHTDHIDGLAWSPSGDRIASASWDTAVRIWNPENGELLALLNGQGDHVHAVGFLHPLPTDGLLVSADDQSVVRVWDYRRLEIRGELRKHQSRVNQLAVAPDALHLASGGADRAVVFWSLLDSQPSYDCGGLFTEVESLVVGVCGDVAAVHSSGDLVHWNKDGGRATGKCHVKGVRSADCASNGAWAVGLADGTVHLGADPYGPFLKSWRSEKSPIRRVGFTPDGSKLYTSHTSDGTLRQWDVATGELTLVVPDATLGCTVEAFAFHPKSPMIAVAGVDWSDVRPTDPAMNMELWNPLAAAGRLRIVASRLPFTPDGSVVIWDTECWDIRRVLSGGAKRVVFSPDGSLIATVTLDDSILLWDSITGELERDLANRQIGVKDLAFDPTGRFLAGGGDDGCLHFWDCRTWKVVETIDLETQIRAVAFLPGGDFVVTGNSNTACYVVSTTGL